jgi:hypothetical protein
VSGPQLWAGKGDLRRDETRKASGKDERACADLGTDEIAHTLELAAVLRRVAVVSGDAIKLSVSAKWPAEIQAKAFTRCHVDERPDVPSTSNSRTHPSSSIKRALEAAQYHCWSP